MKEKILILDFDGVLINGIEEYWFTCSRACDSLLNLSPNTSYINFNKKVPDKFVKFRPLVSKGWEMLLLAFAIISLDNNWDNKLFSDFENDFQHTCKSIANENSFKEVFLQNLLDKSREKVIEEDLNDWISKHKLFFGIKEFLEQLKENKLNFIIISSKNSKFLKHICPQFKINPLEIYGYEDGSKISILRNLNRDYEIIGFVEDRREALEEVLNDNLLAKIPCFFAEWGYNIKGDQINLNKKISIITLKTLNQIFNESYKI